MYVSFLNEEWRMLKFHALFEPKVILLNDLKIKYLI